MRTAAGVEVERDKDADCAAVAGQTAPPDFEDFEGMAEVIGGVIEEAVPQTRTDDGADDHGIDQGVQVVLGSVFPSEKSTGQ